MTDFSDKLIQILNHGSLNLALGIGYGHKIFDIMDQSDTAMTLDELAAATALSPRYLKEWLAIMATGEIIELTRTPEGKDAFSLPKSHGDLLCRRAGNNNLGVYTQEIPLLTACAMEAVQEGFKTGDGVPFSQYPEFQAFMSELSDAKHEQVLVQEFLPSVDRGRLVEALETGIEVCDLGCGQGVALNLMAKAFPNSSFTGMDNHGQAIERAEAAARDMGLDNARFLVQDAAAVREQKMLAHKFDYICAFDAIHDQSHPLAALKGVVYMLKPGGLFSMIDIKAGTRIQDNMDHPMAPFLYTVSLMHCMPVGLNDKGRGLGMMWGKEQAMDLLKEAGFTKVLAEEIPNDAFNLHFQCRT
ncbi:MAG: class I SAM-dependent methyltransferase [Desulfobacter sp.]|nr:MAG: class I SAM-dependent methyltransferase [Desulfobacter sp.]